MCRSHSECYVWQQQDVQRAQSVLTIGSTALNDRRASEQPPLFWPGGRGRGARCYLWATSRTVESIVCLIVEIFVFLPRVFPHLRRVLGCVACFLPQGVHDSWQPLEPHSSRVCARGRGQRRASKICPVLFANGVFPLCFRRCSERSDAVLHALSDAWIVLGLVLISHV